MTDIYLDHNATTDPCAVAVQIAQQLLDDPPGNASSVHLRGQRARAAVELAREQVAAAIGARASEVVFTSGATEANALAVHAIASKRPGGCAITTAMEHPSLLAALRSATGVQVLTVGAERTGQPVMAQFRRALDTPDCRFVSAMAVNNETGVVFAVAEIAALARAAGAVMHTDATQAIGRIDVDVGALDVDMLSLSGHKFGGLAGAGALYVRRGVAAEALIHGHQQDGLRGGTENVIGVAALGAAATNLAATRRAHNALRGLRDQLAAWLQGNVAGTHVNAPYGGTLETGHVLNIAFADVRGADLVLALDVEGVAVSAGSACASGTIEPSHVLRAMPGADALGAIRLSLGPTTTSEELDRAGVTIAAVVARIRGLQ